MLSETTLKKVNEIIERYPTTKGAMLPVLNLVQEELGHISDDALLYVADLLKVTPAEMRGIATFYSMYHDRPIGENIIYVCTNVSCTLLGAESIIDHISKKLGIEVGETTRDKKFTFSTLECLGACDMSPAMMINEDLYGNLTPQKVDEILEKYGKVSVKKHRNS